MPRLYPGLVRYEVSGGGVWVWAKGLKTYMPMCVPAKQTRAVTCTGASLGYFKVQPGLKTLSYNQLFR